MNWVWFGWLVLCARSLILSSHAVGRQKFFGAMSSCFLGWRCACSILDPTYLFVSVVALVPYALLVSWSILLSMLQLYQLYLGYVWHDVGPSAHLSVIPLSNSAFWLIRRLSFVSWRTQLSTAALSIIWFSTNNAII